MCAVITIPAEPSTNTMPANELTPMTNHANPFAPLIDPAAVLAACATSESLSALPTHAHHHADRPSAKATKDLAEFDAAIDAAVTNSSTLGVSGSGKTARRYRGRSGGVERQADFAGSVVEAMHAAVVPTEAAAEMTFASSPGDAQAAVPEVPRTTEIATNATWWSASISWYARLLTTFGMFAVTR